VELTVNGQPRSLPDHTTIAELLIRLNLQGSPCAVEVNKSLIPERQHEQTKLSANDAVEVVTLVGGG
jgi:sulfur carrier protein